MKKSLLAVAVAAALPAVAYAQSNVTLYGMIDTGYMSKKFTDNGALHSKSVGFGGEAAGVAGPAGNVRVGTSFRNRASCARFEAPRTGGAGSPAAAGSVVPAGPADETGVGSVAAGRPAQVADSAR